MAIWLTGYNKAVYYVWISFLAKPSGKAVSLIVSQCDSTTSTVQYITVENNELDSFMSDQLQILLERSTCLKVIALLIGFNSMMFVRIYRVFAHVY